MTSSSRLARVSTTEALEAAIAEEVLHQDFEPGAQIREADLVTRYGVGRNSVRAALQALVHAGLLRHEKNRGVFVPDFTVQDVADLFLLRNALEQQAVATVALEGKPLDGVERAFAELESLDPGSDWTRTTAIDLGLHAAVVSAAGSERMSRTYAGLVLELRLLLAHVQDLYPQPATLVPGHREIVDALRDRDGGRASAALHAHLAESATQIVDAVSQALRAGALG